MKIGKIVRIIRNVPRPIVIPNWPKPKPTPVELPERKKEEVKR